MMYKISDLEHLSGIQSHTIRMWEHRYNAITPIRTEGNTRLYPDDQLKKLLNIVSLNKAGLKISKICNLTDQEFKILIDQKNIIGVSEEWADHYISRLIGYGIGFEESAFVRLLDQIISEYSMSEAYRKVIYPLLVRLGLMWRKDNICPAHEHFLTNIIRQKLYHSINNLPVNDDAADTWLLFLPEDEDHEIGLLFANYLLRLAGQNVIYLGSKVPLDSIEKVFKSVPVAQVLLFMVKRRSPLSFTKLITQLSGICKEATIHIAGNDRLQITDQHSLIPINWIKSLEEFDLIIPKTTHYERIVR